jgi:hypothetical protein
VIECVAREIAQDPVEQQRLTHDHGTRRQRAEIDAFARAGPSNCCARR